MRADYDSKADLVAIYLRDVERIDADEEAHPRAVVSVVGGRAVAIELAHPDLGIEEPVSAVAARYGLDREALLAAASSALRAPDRTVVLDVLARRAA
jgi:hypothetical protein